MQILEIIVRLFWYHLIFNQRFFSIQIQPYTNLIEPFSNQTQTFKFKIEPFTDKIQPSESIFVTVVIVINEIQYINQFDLSL